MTTNTKKARRPKADGTLSKVDFEQALTDAGRVPLLVWSGEHGVTVCGPYHRLHSDKHDKVAAVRS